MSLTAILTLSCRNHHSENGDKEPKHKISSLLDSSNKFKSDSDKTTLPSDIDSSKIKELSKQVNLKHDEFKSITWVQPRNTSKYRSSNAIYCYFAKDSLGRVSNFRFVIQYYSDDWLFIKNYKFIIDSKPFTFTPLRVETDNGNGGYIWEWCDDYILSNDVELIKALASGSNGKIRFEGRQYYDEKTITRNQLQNIKIIYELYIASGGKFN